MRHRRRHRRKSLLGALLFPLFIGLSLLWLGAWFGLRSLGLNLPGIEEMWPVFPILGGMMFYLGFLLNRRAFGLVMPGSLFFLCGIFFLPFSLGALQWQAMEWLWPVFPLIMGMAFVALFVASFGRFLGLLVPATLFLAVGVIALSLTVTPLGSVIGLVGWPVVFLSGGAALVLMSLALISFRLLRVFGTRAL